MSTEEQIKLLIELQKLDSQIFKLRRELANQPVLIKNLEEEFKQKEVDLKKSEEEQKTLAVKRKERELELETKEAGIKKLQAQLYQIKTNKEYQAMEKEIASQKADVSVIEEAILGVLDQIDECTKEIGRQKQILEQYRQKFTQDKTKIDASIKEMEASSAKINAERTELASKVDKKFLAKYERILNSKNGLAMVSIRDDACGGCNINLPPQVINEVRLKQELIFCGSCARILYADDNNS